MVYQMYSLNTFLFPIFLHLGGYFYLDGLYEYIIYNEIRD